MITESSSTTNNDSMFAHSVPDRCIGILGLGYVGLSLAANFGQVLPTIAFDVNPDRIAELRRGYDRNGEVSEQLLAESQMQLTSDFLKLKESDFLVIAVPTSVDGDNRPDLSNLISASQFAGQAIRQRENNGELIHNNDDFKISRKPIVVYESTVYPGCVEELCIPILETETRLKAGQDFYVGYSPERINPGDSEHTFERVVKIVSAQDPDTLEAIAQIYGLLTQAGVYKAPNIMTAESAKVIENIQRDVNIALMNELAILFHRLGIDTQEVLKAAKTKWNFLPFHPGLVGGECIPVNPYYLAHKALAVGHKPDVILAGRRINDDMGSFVAEETAKCLSLVNRSVQGANVLVLGLAFKENVRDTRNSRVIEMIRELRDLGCRVSVYDPVVGKDRVKELSLDFVNDPFLEGVRYDAVVLAVPHDGFPTDNVRSYVDLFQFEEHPGVLMDVRGVLPKPTIDDYQILYWSL